MAKKDVSYRTIRTVEGITLNIFEDEKGITKPHCATGPAILYPKGYNKPDEYYLFGIKYDYDKWLELSRPLRKGRTQEDLQV
jgi:hypothetical protein